MPAAPDANDSRAARIRLTQVTEASVYGIVLISGLIVVLDDGESASWEILLKTVGTVLVFWAAHVYAGAVARLGKGDGSRSGFVAALVDSVRHSNGMLVAALAPSGLLLLGAIGLIGDREAIWGVLWLDVALLVAVGAVGVARWSPRWGPRLLGGVATGVFGVVLILLKALIH